MNYQHLRYFREVAASRTFQQAADKLFITQPTLSRAISALEDELGVELFEKSGRTVTITPYGTEFLRHVENALDEIERGVNSVRSMANRVEGVLNIACIYGYTYYTLPQLLQDFKAIYPQVRFQLRQATTQNAILLVHSGEAEIGFHCASSLMNKYKDLEYFPIQRQDIVAVVPKNHPLASHTSCTLRELSSEKLVSFDSTSGMLYKTQEMFEASQVSFSPCMFVSDDQSILNIVRSGGAAACVLRNVAASCKEVTTLEISDPVDCKMDIYFSVRKNVVGSLVLNTFKEFLLKLCQ